MFFIKFFFQSFFLRLWILGQKVWLAISLAIHWKFFLRRNESQYYAIIRRASNLAILRNCEEMRKRESEVKKNLLSSASQKASKWFFLSISDKNQRINFNSISISHNLWTIKDWFWVFSELILKKTGFSKFSTVKNYRRFWLFSVNLKFWYRACSKLLRNFKPLID